MESILRPLTPHVLALLQEVAIPLETFGMSERHG